MKNLIKSLFVLVAVLVIISPVTTHAYGGGGGGGGWVIFGTAFDRTLGDLTGDGRIDVNDFNAILAAWGAGSTTRPTDFNHDGMVDILDLNVLMKNWNG